MKSTRVIWLAMALIFPLAFTVIVSCTGGGDDDDDNDDDGGGGWRIEIVDDTGWVGMYCDIAVDSMNRVHICYHDYSNKNLKYARQSGGSWMIEVADEEYYTGSSNSIALDSSDNPHIAYNEYSVLKYATRFSGAWLTEIVDMNSFTVGHGCITVDGLDTLHISYHNSSKGERSFVRPQGCKPRFLQRNQRLAQMPLHGLHFGQLADGNDESKQVIGQAGNPRRLSQHFNRFASIS